MKNTVKKILASAASVLMLILTSASAAEKVYKVGDIGPGGGIVFYKNVSGFSVEDGNGESKICHYLEVSAEDLGQATWFPTSAVDMPSSKYGIGEGKAATNEILALVKKSDLTAENCAAYACSKYRTSTTKAGDWFLPTSDEIRQLFKNLSPEKIHIENAEFYWSSSIEDNNKAWARKNKTSTLDTIDNKFMVRAVHAF